MLVVRNIRASHPYHFSECRGGESTRLTRLNQTLTDKSWSSYHSPCLADFALRLGFGIALSSMLSLTAVVLETAIYDCMISWKLQFLRYLFAVESGMAILRKQLDSSIVSDL